MSPVQGEERARLLEPYISSVSLGGLWIWFPVTQSIFNPTCYPLGLRFSSILMGQRWSKGEAEYASCTLPLNGPGPAQALPSWLTL